MNLGERLFELRKAKNLTQDDVAEKLNVSRQTVSKWETDQSTPDFDKIVPLCELFEIGVDELLTGKKPVEEKKQENVLTKQEVKEKSAKVVSSSVFLYFLAIIVLIVSIPVLNMNPVLATALFLLLIGWSTTRIIRHYMSIPKFEQTEEEIQMEERQKNIQGVYELRNEKLLQDKKILLIDDIYTTGSTVNECARMLEQAHPKFIGVFTLAKD